MRIAKPYKWLFGIILLGAAAFFILFFRMYHDDIKALKGFMAAYETFDKAISSYADRGGIDALGQAGEAVIELQARASLRLSSLIRNDAQLMDQAREIADLSRRELDGLKAYAAALESRDLSPEEALKKDELAKEYGVLRGKRTEVFAHFKELGGVS